MFSTTYLYLRTYRSFSEYRRSKPEKIKTNGGRVWLLVSWVQLRAVTISQAINGEHRLYEVSIDDERNLKNALGQTRNAVFLDISTIFLYVEQTSAKRCEYRITFEKPCERTELLSKPSKTERSHKYKDVAALGMECNRRGRMTWVVGISQT